MLVYANNTDIIGRTARAVKGAFSNQGSAAKKMVLTINESKIKYMEVPNNPTNTQHVSMKQYKFQKVN
jgi:hypothetical protein